MNRCAINELVKWKNGRRRKPLIVEGARQVGKTWLVKDFARRHYENFASRFTGPNRMPVWK